MTTATRTAIPPPRPGANGAARPVRTFTRSKGIARSAHRVLVYGTGGIGKSTLAAASPSPIFADLEGGSGDFDVERINGLKDWADLRFWLQSGDFDGVKTIVIDTVTTAEDWCRQHVIANVKTDKGLTVNSIEGFGWGKGYALMFEEWRRMLADLERHFVEGRNVVLVAHEQIGKVPNPTGDDYIRYQPRLFVNNQVSLLHTTKEWCDHVLFISYDVAAKDGKAKGSGTRTIYTVEEATHMAKTRTLGPEPIIFEPGSNAVWQKMLTPKQTDDMPV